METEKSYPHSENEEAHHFSREEIANARDGFEMLAKRLDVLWSKEGNLTEAEQREVDLILNNAMILEEIARGEIPEELRSNER